MKLEEELILLDSKVSSLEEENDKLKRLITERDATINNLRLSEYESEAGSLYYNIAILIFVLAGSYQIAMWMIAGAKYCLSGLST